jgi:hypothetical protein
MRFYLQIFACVVLFCSTSGHAQMGRSSASNDALNLRVLQAIEYADLTRVVTLSMCKRKPELVTRLPACAKISGVPNAFIEQMALPHFNRYISPVNAKSALQFWSSDNGAKIAKKMLREIAENNPTLLTTNEKQLLNNFNQSEAGVALKRLAQDRDVSQSIIRAVGAY